MDTPHQRHLTLSLLAYAVQRGVSVNSLCDACGIDLDSVRANTAAVTSRQMSDLWMHAAQSCHDPLFGLHFGESLQLAALGVVGQIIQSAATVGEAVTMAASLSGVVTDLYAIDVTKGRSSFTISFRTQASVSGSSAVLRQLRDFLVVFVIHELDGLLLRKVAPLSVTLPEAVMPLAEYQRVLRCTPVHKAGVCRVTFAGVYWNEPIITANHELKNILLQRAGNGLPPTLAFKGRILTYLEGHAYLGILSLEEVAANFNMSPRSLQRRLREEQVTFQQLADTVRKSLALQYVNSGSYPVKEISVMLGYNELSAFSRAFKRWTGKAPGRYVA
jgi:AraC-like DNA-binding protein